MSERDLIDLAVKQYTQPKLWLNTDVLDEHLNRIRTEKGALLNELGVEKSDLMSDKKFADLLIAAGYDENALPTKISQATGKDTLSFSKTHPVVRRMLENPPNERIGKLFGARLAMKSTLEETRAERMLTLGGTHEPDAWYPTHIQLPAGIMYWAAHTGRYGGGDKINLQNLGRGSFLREAIVAGDGQKVLAGDLAQIEARITAEICGQTDLVEQFRDDVDVYANFATQHYGYKVNKEDHPTERFVGKTGILSLGYQSGAERFHDTMNNVFGTSIRIDEAESVVNTYRRQFKQIKSTWYELNDYIEFMANSTGGYKEFGPVSFTRGKMIMPNGMPIFYPDLKRKGGEYTYQSWKGRTPWRKKLYGGALLENIVQALARIVMTRAVDKFLSHNIVPAMSVHDELVFAVMKEKVEIMAAAVKGVMEQPVPWMPNLPVKCEVNFGDNYAECK